MQVSLSFQPRRIKVAIISYYIIGSTFLYSLLKCNHFRNTIARLFEFQNEKLMRFNHGTEIQIRKWIGLILLIQVRKNWKECKILLINNSVKKSIFLKINCPYFSFFFIYFSIWFTCIILKKSNWFGLDLIIIVYSS